MPAKKSSTGAKESTPPPSGPDTAPAAGSEGQGTPVTEKPVPQKVDLARYILSVDNADGTIVKMEKLDEKTGEPRELDRDEYAAAFAFAGYPLPLKKIPSTEREQAMNMNSLAYNQGAADAAASLAAYGIVPDQFGGYSDSFGGHTDATGGYSDAFGGYSDAVGGYYDATGGYTDAYGGYSDAAGGYSDAYGGYSDATGGYTDAYGGYTDAAGGYTDVLGGYLDPDGGYTDATGNYTDPATVAYALGTADAASALGQMPY
jgi:hypothetical protein